MIRYDHYTDKFVKVSDKECPWCKAVCASTDKYCHECGWHIADTPQTDKDKVVCPNCGRSDYIRSFEKDFNIKNSEYRYKCINCNTYINDTPLDATNIDTSEDEMKVLDSFLFRCWQMGWLDRYNHKTEPTISKMEQVDKDINVRSKDEPQTDCGDFADRLAYERGVKHAWEVAQKVFDSTVAFYEAEDFAKNKE